MRKMGCRLPLHDTTRSVVKHPAVRDRNPPTDVIDTTRKRQDSKGITTRLLEAALSQEQLSTFEVFFALCELTPQKKK